MKLKSIIASLLCCIVIATTAQVNNLPRKEMNNREYYVYKVEKGEGFNSVCKKFDITKEDIIKYNPSAKNGLKRDQVLFIPVNGSEEQDKTAQNTEPFRHTISRGETLYAISQMYDVSVDDICALNPGSRKRIVAGETLLIPQTAQATQTAQQADGTASDNTQSATEYVYHTISKGETLYAISIKYDVSVESIMRSNPGIRPQKLYEGTVIRVPQTVAQENIASATTTQQQSVAATTPQKETRRSDKKEENDKKEETTTGTPTSNTPQVESQATVAASQQYDTYDVKRRETLYSISQKFDISIEELIAANPGIEKLHAGMTINIPKQSRRDTSIANGSITPADEQDLEELYNFIYAKRQSDHINVAVILPFNLHQKADLKSMLYTEYYQGFLLAVDSLKRDGYSVNVAAYDTEGSIEKVEEILSEPKMTLMDLIIAPEQEDAIDMIADFGETHNINVVNSFSMKNEKVANNARVFQTNIPASYFYAETVDTFIELFADRNIIFLADMNRAEEKNEFVDQLIFELDNKNIPYSTLKYTDVLAIEQMYGIDRSHPIVFVPMSNKKDVPAQIIEGIETYRLSYPSCQLSLFGYPSWVPQINKNIGQFYRLDTYMFSRFYTHPDDRRLFEFDKKFIFWYNTEIKNASPRYALLGYDTGIYFLNAIAQNGKNFANHDVKQYSASIQTDFRFERINNWSGFINKSFYWIHFTPEMTIEKIKK